MKKFKAAGWKPVVPSRSNTTSSIRGRISAPIPHGPTAAAAVDEEFPLRTPGTSVAAPLGHDGLGLQLGAPPAPLQADTTQYERGDIPAGAERPSKAVSSVPSSAVPSHETPISQARQASPLPGSGVSNPSASSIEKPQRKKSTLKSVLGRLFGKKRKSASSVNVGREDSPRAGQHRSVSIICYIWFASSPVYRILRRFESPAAKPNHRNVQLPCPSMTLVEPGALTRPLKRIRNLGPLVIFETLET